MSDAICELRELLERPPVEARLVHAALVLKVRRRAVLAQDQAGVLPRHGRVVDAQRRPDGAAQLVLAGSGDDEVDAFRA